MKGQEGSKTVEQERGRERNSDQACAVCYISLGWGEDRRWRGGRRAKPNTSPVTQSQVFSVKLIFETYIFSSVLYMLPTCESITEILFETIHELSMTPSGPELNAYFKISYNRKKKWVWGFFLPNSQFNSQHNFLGRTDSGIFPCHISLYFCIIWNIFYLFNLELLKVICCVNQK